MDTVIPENQSDKSTKSTITSPSVRMMSPSVRINNNNLTRATSRKASLFNVKINLNEDDSKDLDLKYFSPNKTIKSEIIDEEHENNKPFKNDLQMVMSRNASEVGEILS